MSNKENHNEENHSEKIFEKIENMQNCLKYYYMLDIPNISSISFSSSANKIQQWIDECFAKTNTACQSIVPYTNYFFSSTSPRQKLHTDLAQFESEYRFWLFCYKQSCILSAYDKIRKLISYDKDINTPSYARLLFPVDSKEETCKITSRYGLHYILNEKTRMPNISFKHGIISDISSFEDMDENTKADYGATIYSKSSNAKTQAKKLLNSLTKYYSTECLSVSNNKINDYTSLLQPHTLEFFQYTSGRKLESGKFSNIKHILATQEMTNFKKNDYTKYFDDFSKIISELKTPGFDPDTKISTSEGCNLNLADKIYCRYLLEKVFAFSTIDCIYNNIKKSTHSDYLSQSLDMISACFLLPNVFSRHYILQMALDTLKYDYFNNLNFSELDSRVGMTTKKHFNKITMTYQKYYIWAQRYNEMINVLVKLAFPIYDNLFFATLWNSVYSKKKDEYDCISDLFYILSKYLNDESIVRKLLSLEDAITDNNSNIRFFNNYDASHIINPFQNKQIDDYNMYLQCIKSATKNKDIHTPDFLDYNYIQSIDPDIAKETHHFIYNIVRESY